MTSIAIFAMAEVEKYTVRQIEEKFSAQTRDLKEHMELLIRPVYDQVLKTNGRVNKHDDDIMSYKIWRGWMTGGMAGLMLLLPALSGLIVYIFINHG